ncbi:MAG TPA: hypothetical protein VM535_01610 [Candidatus Saccharimonadales bacterium]|nr:hypothetical protein [Candidatus Saccharimonadales bacterium]
MSRSPRAEALRLVQTEAAIAPPGLPSGLLPNSPEALAYVDSFKEAHFAALAHVTDLMLSRALEARRPGDSFHPAVTQKPVDGWTKLADSWRRDLRAASQSIKSTRAYDVADRFAQVTGRLNTRRHISLETKLEGGAGTAIITSLTMLRNLPHIIRHHARPDESLDSGAVARHPRSAGLIRRLAKQSINQTLAAQTALEGRSQATSWGNLSHVLQPDRFSLHRYDDDSASLAYADFDGLTVPAGYRPHEPFAPVRETTRTKDIPSEQSKTVGCPVTLLQGRLAEIWHWGIDMVEANGLWDENWPPAAADVRKPALSQPS